MVGRMENRMKWKYKIERMMKWKLEKQSERERERQQKTGSLKEELQFTYRHSMRH